MTMRPGLSVMVDWSCEHGSHDDGSWPELLQALEELDGQDRCSMVVNDAEGLSMTVSGGNAGLYFVTLDRDNVAEASLLDLDQSEDEELEVNTGGGHMSLPARNCVSLGAAVLAMQHFVEHGGLDPGLPWEWLRRR
ncbi:Imm1 family immunity protein [Archangium lansingense]|uniref:Imm1 family immunity protein n=1 Tax=Archangium lansingense TaxID=2995310 RepID=UPI003B804BC8